jgi:hypothetical protein
MPPSASPRADDAACTPPECAPWLVLALATGKFDALAGRYLHAEHDPPEVLRRRIEEIKASNLNAIRRRRWASTRASDSTTHNIRR